MNLPQGIVVWFTGLSGAGKSTLAEALAAELRLQGQNVYVLDADVIRQGLCSNLGFTPEDRLENVRRITHAAKLLSAAGVTVLVASISPLASTRLLARTILPDMIEVFVDTSLAVCESRDPKGLYKSARAGKILNFTGIDAPYEAPKSPDIICRTAEQSIQQSLDALLQGLAARHQPVADTPAPTRRPTIAVDFDGVLADYDFYRGPGVLGAPRTDTIAVLTALRERGWKIVLHTTRGQQEIQSYLNQHGVPFDEINRNSDYRTQGHKPVATVYWDDRAVCYSGDAHQDLLRILNFKTWTNRT